MIELFKQIKRAWNNRHWDIESGLQRTNEEAAAYHKQMYEALTGKCPTT